MSFSTTDKILIIVESPNKRDTIQSILKKAGYANVSVDASYGHIMTLADDRNSWKNSGIYPENSFALNLVVNKDKYKVVSQLQTKVNLADKIVIASDSDREGHVIAWSLLKFLTLDINKCYRMVMHEITAKAVQYALENPIPFNDNMVEAGLARLGLDKMIAWGISPEVRTYVGAKSAGRCQSAGLLILYEREQEILNFKPETYYDIYLNFTKNKIKFRAKYMGTAGHTVDHLYNRADVDYVLEACNGHYKVVDILRRNKQESPKPPFSTSTFQQEAVSKLNLSVKAAQSCAQKLFEGIEVNHQHTGLVTYIRTDSTEMSAEFLPELQKYIENTYGANAFVKPRVGKKKETDQDGHEALRVVDPNLTPEILATYIKDDLLIKVYRLIWQRTIAAAMPNAVISETTYIIENNGQLFSLVSNELVEAGYRDIYNYLDEDNADDEKDDVVKETFLIGDTLKYCKLEDVEKATKPKPRYKAHTFIKELEKRNVGRPSTYEKIELTVTDPGRNYCVVEANKEMKLTELGMRLAEYLIRAFPNLININYTTEMEKQLDRIANGELDRVTFMQEVYEVILEAIGNNKEGIPNAEEKVCPKCGAPMVVRRNRYKKLFYGCSKYPNCNGIIGIN